MVKPDRRAKAASRPHHGRLGPASDRILGIFRCVRYVAETAAMVSRTAGITDTHTTNAMIYHAVKSDMVKADVTQATIKTGVAAKAARTWGLDVEPDFKTPAIRLNNRCRRLNGVDGGYVITTNIGFREHSGTSR